MSFIYKLLVKLLTIFHVLYLIRFPLIIFFFLLLLRFLIFNFNIGTNYLMGLFDVPHWQNVLWVAFFSLMLSWTAMTLMRITLKHGQERFQWGDDINLDFVHRPIFYQLLFIFSCLCPAILFTGIFWLEGEKLYAQIGGLIGGMLLAFAVLILVDFFQLLLSDFRARKKEAYAGDMLFPFPNWFYKKAAGYSRKHRPFEIKAKKRLEKFLKGLPSGYGKGYVERYNGGLGIYPAHIFAGLMFLVFLAIYVAGFTLWYYSYTPSASGTLNKLNIGVTSISYVLMLLTLLGSVFSGIAFLFDRFRIPTLVVAAGILYFAQLTHTYNVRPLEASRPLTPAEVLAQKSDHPYLILVAINGGGIQATAWSVKVLSELVRECKRIDTREKGCENSIALISSVSGGSVGSMFFVNSYDDTGHLSDERLVKAVELSRASSLDYVAGGLVYADFVRNLRPFDFLNLRDRGDALERSWTDKAGEVFSGGDAHYARSLDGYLSSWREDARAGRRPAVIFNSTMVETGDRFIFSTSDTDRPEDDNLTESIESTRSLPCDNEHKILFRGWDRFYNFSAQRDIKKDVKITSAVRLSASFPFVSPAASMKPGDAPEAQKGEWEKTLESRHFVDGGYHENYGISSLLDWLDEGLCLAPQPPPRILIVQIVGDHVFTEKKGESLGKGWFDQTLAPAETILGVRGTVQLARNESELKLFLRYWRDKKISIEKTVFEYIPQDDNELAPLSWHLTPDQKKHIDGVWRRACDYPNGTNNEALRAFREFILPGVQTPPVCP